jgi:hypothetical protein
MILPFAISAVFALAGRVKIAKILTASGFILLPLMFSQYGKKPTQDKLPFIVFRFSPTKK